MVNPWLERQHIPLCVTIVVFVPQCFLWFFVGHPAIVGFDIAYFIVPADSGQHNFSFWIIGRSNQYVGELNKLNIYKRVGWINFSYLDIEWIILNWRANHWSHADDSCEEDTSVGFNFETGFFLVFGRKIVRPIYNFDIRCPDLQMKIH